MEAVKTHSETFTLQKYVIPSIHSNASQIAVRMIELQRMNPMKMTRKTLLQTAVASLVLAVSAES